MKNLKSIFIMITVALIGALCSCNYVDDANNTVFKETKVSTLLRKYEWFKDASASLDSKLASLGMYESRFKSMKQSYGADSTKRKNWQRSDIEQWNVWESEYLGIKASYNDLASEYNSAMAKINYAFCNAGDMPDGASHPLPREFKPYIEH